MELSSECPARKYIKAATQFTQMQPVHATLRGQGTAAAVCTTPELLVQVASTCASRSIPCGSNEVDCKGARIMGIRWMPKEGRRDGNLSSSLVIYLNGGGDRHYALASHR
ncbi:hypothetical protein L211DRAFT_692414 [Terfezia boudieri ATCC MYA-4762]|uniref:Uncharacterized protein n=1 Tax=Terfezia boudieri ATCC MYA-4762 TaxID=1051890 RepID=A0A3N4LB47_9PEZI|nr:hypothetical protein L211DRAFT_692414 [Terfezia boudieri ATCC MYA-4762]